MYFNQDFDDFARIRFKNGYSIRLAISAGLRGGNTQRFATESVLGFLKYIIFSGMENECNQYDTPHDNISLDDGVPLKQTE